MSFVRKPWCLGSCLYFFPFKCSKFLLQYYIITCIDAVYIVISKRFYVAPLSPDNYVFFETPEPVRNLFNFFSTWHLVSAFTILSYVCIYRVLEAGELSMELMKNLESPWEVELLVVCM